MKNNVLQNVIIIICIIKIKYVPMNVLEIMHNQYKDNKNVHQHVYII